MFLIWPFAVKIESMYVCLWGSRSTHLHSMAYNVYGNFWTIPVCEARRNLHTHSQFSKKYLATALLWMFRERERERERERLWSTHLKSSNLLWACGLWPVSALFLYLQLWVAALCGGRGHQLFLAVRVTAFSEHQSSTPNTHVSWCRVCMCVCVCVCVCV